MSRFMGSLAVMAVALTAVGCTHPLEVRNLAVYSTAVRLTPIQGAPDVAILPYSGSPDGLFYFNALVERLNASPSVGELMTDYIAGEGSRFQPDLILSISPAVTYRSSGWNFLVNWPGFLIFAPAWNGYVYYADINTTVVVHDGDGRQLSQVSVPMSYGIRQTDSDRGALAEISWLEVSLIAFVGGLYNATTFDRDIIGQLQTALKDNYATYIANEVQPKVRAAWDVSQPRPESLPGVGAGSEPD